MNIIGRKPVLELLRSDKAVKRVVLVLGSQGRIVGDILSAAKSKGIRVDRVPSERATQVLGHGNHQGVLAELSPVTYYSIRDINDTIPIENGLIVVLDGVTDQHHLGAIARSALAAGADAIMLQERRGALPNEISVKISAGTLLRLPVIVETNISRAVELLKKDGWWVHGTFGEAGTDLWEHEWDEMTLLVIGSEGDGISHRVTEFCDHKVRIPMGNEVESLSASAAASVILFDIVRKRT
ncbi:MAG TPA: 23S rRNA (guanosine(2251)-2'-O)-methyltransferase RlmB [Bacteroidetes bacterium]|nr:putative TrmH family tRNA/rRNA methyltransferase [bacterium BMS3Bbin04]HDO66209.1 23S rRNA (guanosine(2251)-2'-O)-methyltransferase RlmB [Bacteroidota bacterium]HEX05334.1 23S rRNA (guanosine(2251)-2'-O)-methyltransferase RlmB [Bacteroidota bacterium]